MLLGEGRVFATGDLRPQKRPQRREPSFGASPSAASLVDASSSSFGGCTRQLVSVEEMKREREKERELREGGEWRERVDCLCRDMGHGRAEVRRVKYTCNYSQVPGH